MTWARRDWAQPVGYFDEISQQFVETRVGDHVIFWARVLVPELRLSRRAALLLLQGMPLGQLLLPNQDLRFSEGGPTMWEAIHLVLRVDPWKYYVPVPRLSGLVLAVLERVPDALSPEEILAAVAANSAA